MKLQNSCLIPVGLSESWDFLLDVTNAAKCVPGVVEVSQGDEGTYSGALRARVGPMSITLQGTVSVQEQDAESGRARFLVEASDRRVGGGVKTDLLMQLKARSAEETELLIETDTTFMGRLGELGQPVIRRKAQTTIEEFARNIARELEGRM